MPLLQTKFYIPAIRNELIARPRLINKLNQGLHGKLSLISAPAGFGKTTLISHWLGQMHHPTAWLSLDDTDNDPVRFLTNFTGALHQVLPGIGQYFQISLQTRQQASNEFVLVSLINRIAALPAKTVLVLDDYHRIKDEGIHQAMDFLIQHLPQQLHLVITSRADPPLSLSRLRARGEMTELRSHDLRFDHFEATAFLKQSLSPKLSAAQVQSLEAKTEGWAAGLKMAALSLQRHEDIPRFIEAFSGCNRYIYDYLAEEVLERQPPEIQSFLMQTAILERMTAPLCDALTGNGNSQVTLSQLEQANLFLVSLDDDRRWYRYHHLFADFLRQRLAQTQPNRTDALHQRACAWYAAHEFTAEAIEHALIGRLYDQAAALLIRIAESLWMRAEFSTVLSWLERFPAEFVRVQPRLCLYYAWTLSNNRQQFDGVVSRLQEAEAVLEKDAKVTESASNYSKEERSELWGIIAAIRSALPPIPDQPLSRLEYAREAFKLLPENSLTWRGIAAISQGVGYRAQGQLVAAHQALSEAQAINQAAHNQYLRWAAMINLAEVQRLQGQLNQAFRTYQQILGILIPSLRNADPLLGPDTPVVDPLMQSDIYIGLGTITLAWNQLETAESYLRQGLTLMRKSNNYSIASKGYMALVGLLQAQGKTEAAIHATLEMEQLATEHLHTIQDPQLTACNLAWMWLQHDRQSNASEWAGKAGLVPPSGQVMPENFRYEFGYLVLARLRIAQNRPRIALTILSSLRPDIQETGQIDRLVGILILETMAYHQQGDQAGAMNTLEQALTLAEPGGYIRLWVDQGEAMAALLHRAREQGIHVHYVRKLLEAFGDKPDSSTCQPLIEALTAREMEVLQCVARGQTNQEIADDLFISLATVKKHLSNIFGKLDVHNRTQATARAQEHGLI